MTRTTNWNLQPALPLPWTNVSPEPQRFHVSHVLLANSMEKHARYGRRHTLIEEWPIIERLPHHLCWPIFERLPHHLDWLCWSRNRVEIASFHRKHPCRANVISRVFMRCKAVAVTVLKQVVSCVLKFDLRNGSEPSGSDSAFTPRTEEKTCEQRRQNFLQSNKLAQCRSPTCRR